MTLTKSDQEHIGLIIENAVIKAVEPVKKDIAVIAAYSKIEKEKNVVRDDKLRRLRFAIWLSEKPMRFIGFITLVVSLSSSIPVGLLSLLK